MESNRVKSGISVPHIEGCEAVAREVPYPVIEVYPIPLSPRNPPSESPSGISDEELQIIAQLRRQREVQRPVPQNYFEFYNMYSCMGFFRYLQIIVLSIGGLSVIIFFIIKYSV